MLAVLSLVACGSTPQKTSHQSTTKNPSSANTYIGSGIDTKLFAKLIKVKDGYEFKQFTTIRPSTRSNEPWVELDTGIPFWDTSDRDGCAMDNLGLSKSTCDINEELFIDTHRNVSGAIIGAVMTMGLASAVDVKFDKALYIASYQNALDKLSYNDKRGVEAVRTLPNVVKLVNSFKNTKSKITAYQDLATSNSFELTSLPDRPNYYGNSFNDFNTLTAYVSKLTEYLNSIEHNGDALHQEVNAKLIAKIRLMNDDDLFDWIKSNYHKQYVSQTTQNIAAERANKLALKKISKFKSYQEAEQWVQFRSHEKYIAPATVNAGNTKFLKLFNEAYEAKAKSAKSLNDYRYIINVFGAFQDKLYSTKYLNIAKTKVEEYAQERAEQQRLYEAQQRKKFIAKVTSYRSSLSEGQDSHCGLVVEVKDKVIRVETMIGLKFFKRDQLYPAGLASCSFRNNIYQPPKGFSV